MSTEQTTPCDILTTPFAAAMTREAAGAMRRSLEVSTNIDLMALYGFAVLDRDGMIAMLRSVVEDDGEAEAVKVLEALASITENLKRVHDITNMIEARAVIAMHVVLGLSLEDTAPAEEVQA